MTHSRTRSALIAVTLVCIAAFLGAGCPSPVPPNGTQLLVSFGSDMSEADQARVAPEIKSILDRRMRSIGFEGHEITPAGKGKLLIKLHGVHTTNNVKNQQMVSGLRVELARRGALQFRLLHPDSETIVAEDGEVPEGFTRLDMKDKDGNVTTSYILSPPIDGLGTKNVKKSEALAHKDGKTYVVSVEFDEVGAKVLTDVTTKFQNRSIALMVDDRVYNVMNINQTISDGKAAITGIGLKSFAAQLVIALNSGELPADITIGEPETYGTPPVE